MNTILVNPGQSLNKKKFGVSDSSITRIINTHGKPRFGNYKFKDIYPSVIKDYQNGMKELKIYVISILLDILP